MSFGFVHVQIKEITKSKNKNNRVRTMFSPIEKYPLLQDAPPIFISQLSGLRPLFFFLLGFNCCTFLGFSRVKSLAENRKRDKNKRLTRLKQWNLSS